MGTCKTCKHWVMPNDMERICAPEDPDTYEPMEMPFQVRQCTHPVLVFSERPLEPNGFALCDGSGYWAGLYTAEGFGCVNHEVS